MAGSGQATGGVARAASRVASAAAFAIGLLGASLPGAGLGCGARAEGTSSDADDAPVAPVDVPARGGPTRLGGASGATTPSEAPSISPDAVQTYCYSLAELERTPELQEMLPTLPVDAFDGAGCLAADYSSLLIPGRCLYDPSGAELTEGRCCYRMDSLTAECP
jgi:hypothetical protein